MLISLTLNLKYLVLLASTAAYLKLLRMRNNVSDRVKKTYYDEKI